MFVQNFIANILFYKLKCRTTSRYGCNCKKSPRNNLNGPWKYYLNFESNFLKNQ